MADIFISYFHYFGLAVLLAALSTEHLIFDTSLDAKQAKRIAVIDVVYVIAMIIVLTTGLLKLFAVGKPAVYYLQNWIFHIKLTLFIIMAALSVYPTIHFVRNRNLSENETATYPGIIKMLLRVELLIFLIMPLLGVMMARGLGYINCRFQDWRGCFSGLEDEPGILYNDDVSCVDRILCIDTLAVLQDRQEPSRDKTEMLSWASSDRTTGG